MYDKLLGFLQISGHQTTRHITSNHVLSVDIHAVISVMKLLVSKGLKSKFKGKLRDTISNPTARRNLISNIWVECYKITNHLKLVRKNVHRLQRTVESLKQTNATSTKLQLSRTLHQYLNS
jgi:hypothetical protein